VLKDGCVVKAGKAPSLRQADEDLGLDVESSINSTEADVLSLPVAVKAAPAHGEAPLDQDAIDALDPKRQQGDWSVYSYYFNAAGRFEVILFLALMVLWTVCESFSGVFSRLLGIGSGR